MTPRKGFAQTVYDGPVETMVLNPGGRRIVVVRPADPDRLLDAPEVLEENRRDDYMPYWAYLWPGAYLLASHLAEHEVARPGTEALEIGCGLGLAGLTAMSAGWRVTFTDYDATPLQFVERSAAENAFPRDQFETALLDWRDLPDRRWPIILGADVLYERRLVPLVVNLIDRLLLPGGLALIGGPYRVATQAVPFYLEERELTASAFPLTARDESGAPVRGTIHVIRRAGDGAPAG